MASETSTTEVLALLRASHDRLTAALTQLTEQEVAGPSYDDDWSIAQVASHLGSSAEVFALFLEAGRTGSPEPGPDAMQPVWDQWNAKPPAVQASDSVAADSAFLDQVADLSGDDQEQWRLDLFGSERRLAEFLQMRLSEHAMHSWDILVTADPALGLPEDAAAAIVDQLGMIAGYSGKAPDEPLLVTVRTTGPDLSFLLRLGPDSVQVEAGGDPSAAAQLSLPAEAFVRLVYGRLDPDHTPDSVTATGVDLDLLRRTFPGV